MAKTRYLEYQIFLTDRAVVAAHQAEFPNGVRVAPATAAVTYAAPIQEFLSQWAAPCTTSPHFWLNATDNYPRDEDSFTRKSGGWFGISGLFPTTTTFIWVGKFIYGPPAVAEIDGVATEVVAMAQRRWCIGFEIPEDGEGSGGTASRSYSRDASRHPDGMGWAFRGGPGAISQVPNQFGAAGSSDHWDRFYVRVRKAPTTAGRIWLGGGSFELKLTAGLQLLASNVVGGLMVPLSSTTTALELDTWARIDIVLSYATAAAGVGAYAKIHINGVLALNLTTFPDSGLGAIGMFNSVAIALGSANAEDYEADFDDWIGALPPVKETAAPHRYVGKDWLNGSKVVRIRATGFGTGHDAVNWTNQSYSNLNQLPESAATGMASTTAAAAIVVTTDAATRIDAQPNTLGIAALLVGVYHTGITAGAASLGYSMAGGALQLLVLPSVSGAQHQHHMLHPAGETTPFRPVAPLTLHYLKDNDASLDTVWHLNAVAELIGIFGPEDVAPGTTEPETLTARVMGAHNNPYPESPWARDLKAPAPYIIHSGTYTGNGTGQNLLFRLPVHWFYTRRTGTPTNAPGLWFASMLASHQSLGDQVQPDCPVQAFIDPTFSNVAGTEDAQEQRTVVRITGADAQVNENTITYQYVAVCDPAARFLLTGGLAHGALDATNVDALPNAAFLPESGFLQYEAPEGGSTFRGYFKGLGHAANSISRMDSAETADFLSWAAGALTTYDAATLSVTLTAAYALWRRDDGSGDVGVGKTSQMGTYVGDGTASRTVAFGPIGVRPLWVVVVPSNAQAILRDPANTGTTSHSWTGANQATTGITAGGIDSFTVGILLNATGITYSWFLLPGGVTACNGGFSCDGEFLPVEPETPEELCDDPDATNFGELGVCVYGETPPASTTCDDPLATNYGGALPCLYDTVQPPGGECTDPDSTCVTATTNVVNLALFEIGVSRVLTNYCTQSDREAVVARTVYDQVVRTVLHAYPWPFATKYQALTLAPTQPSHADWTYCYRAPSDCLFERRLVVSRGTGVDPEPPAFMLSSEPGGGLIFSNEANAVLEYTYRPACVAVAGDALFIEALKWKLGAVLAPPLTRMDAPAARCQAEYEKCLEKANAIKKPGVPGVRTAAPLVSDEAAACVAANVQVVNRGLLRIGCQTIANLATDQSRPAVAANLILEDEIRATLRDYPWKFAKRYLSTLTVVSGSATVRANTDWQYAYRLPSDYVMVRRLALEGTGRGFEDSPAQWEVGTDATGDVLFSDEVTPNLEYTARIPCVVQKADDLFRDALAWRIAAALAPSLAQVDPAHPEQVGRGPDAPPDGRQRYAHKPNQAALRQNAVRYAQAMYRITLERARIQDANEAEPDDAPDAEWIRGR